MRQCKGKRVRQAGQAIVESVSNEVTAGNTVDMSCMLQVHNEVLRRLQQQLELSRCMLKMMRQPTGLHTFDACNTCVHH